jgi:hypothetical protein
MSVRQDSSGYESSREAAAFGFAPGELAEQIRRLRAKKRTDHIDHAYLAMARKDNPNAPEEVVREAALRLQEGCRRNAREFAAGRYPAGTYRELPR